MAEPLLAIRGLRKRFGGLLATDQVDLSVVEGETYAIIGPNGAGKTTLIGQLAGELRPVAGMGLDESQRMVRFLGTLKGHVTIVLVEHDMDAVFTLADRISVMVYGKIIATGTPRDVRGNPDVRRAYLGEEAPSPC